jgi:hypothetical protein
MDWLQFTAAVIGHLAWPVVILILLILVRHQIGALAERLLEFSFGGAKVTFDKALEKGAEIIEERSIAPSKDQPQLPPPVGEVSDPIPRGSAFTTDRVNLNRYVLRTSALQILSAFEEIDRVLVNLADDIEYRNRNPYRVLRYLGAEGKIPREMVDLYETLSEGRNAVAHSGALPSGMEVAEYMRQAGYLTLVLEALRAELKAEKKNPRLSGG